MKLLFVHVPKTGGTSLVNNCLLEAIPLAHRFTEDDLVLHDAYRGHQNVFGEMIALSNHYRCRYRDVFEMFVRNGLVPSNRVLYSGHFCYGVHEVLNDDFRYLTIIRNPVDRVISNYNLHRSIGVFTSSFAEYLDSGWFQARNLQVKMLSINGMKAGATLGTDDLDEVKLNLRRYFDFTALEYLDRFASDLMARHGWNFPYSGAVHNRTVAMKTVKGNPAAAHRSFEHEISTADRVAAREANTLDWELYQWSLAESTARWGELRAAA